MNNKEIIETFEKVNINDIEGFTSEALKSYSQKDTVLWLVYLSKLNSKFFFKKYFNQIIKSPDDLFLFVQICRRGNIRNGLGRCVKREINNWLHSNILLCPERSWSMLKDVIRLTRPCFRNDSDFQNIVKQVLVSDN